jgi:signal transduction histidine kinase/CheY-like chemotaxis protein/HPt (histidine-containing phosphotransfer) domain-containing protein
MKLKKILMINGKEVLFVFIAFFIMILVSYLFISNIVKNQTALAAKEKLRAIEALVYAEYRGAEAALLDAAFSIQTRLDHRQSLEQIEAYQDAFSRWHTGNESSMAGSVNIYGYIRGKFIGIYGESDENAGSFSGDPIPRECPWYIAAENNPDGIAAADPYIDSQTGKIMFSLSKVLKNSRGEKYGVIALDVDINKVMIYIENLQPEKNSYTMMTDQNLVFIAHPNNYHVGKSMEEFSDIHKKIAKTLRTGLVETPSIRIKNRDGKKMITFFRQMFNGWYVGAAVDINTYYQRIYHMAAILISLGLILMIILSYFLIRLGIEKMSSDEKNRSKSSFLARISHEIRTPMNSILGMSELVMRKDISKEVHEYISIINQSGISLLAIINDILDFSRMESSQFHLGQKEYFCSSLINDIINMMRIRFMNQAVEFFVYVDAGIPAQLIGDEIRIRQVLINLLSNAVKYTRRGFISLDVHYKKIDEDKLELIFTVTDTGIGIKEEDIKKLFSDFTRIDSSHNYHIEGTGLGLPIARTLCRAMDGDITVSSEYGKGSIFTARIIQSFSNPKKLASIDQPETKRVLLYEERLTCLKYSIAAMEEIGIDPICPSSLQNFIAELETGEYDYAFVPSAHAQDCVRALEKSGSSSQLIVMTELGMASIFKNMSSIMMPIYSITAANIFNGITCQNTRIHKEYYANFMAPAAKVLIVDDISTNLKVAKELMAPYQMEIHTCMQGADAVEMSKNNGYDIIFLDHMMPGMDGMEAAAAIRGLNDTGKQPSIVMLTANAGSEQKDIFFRSGIDAFLEKPIEIKKLDALLERWIPREKQITTACVHRGNPLRASATHDPRIPITIPKVNVLSGLNNTGGSIETYLNILANFCQDAKAQTRQIKQAAETDNIHLYTVLIHGLKGSAKSIGADEFSGFAGRIEEEINRGDIRVIRDKTGEFLEDLRTLTDTIYTILNQNAGEAENRTETTISKPQMEVLKEALIKMDIEMVNRLFIEYTSSPMPGQVKNSIAEIEQDVLMFEYKKAIEKIDDLALKLG